MALHETDPKKKKVLFSETLINLGISEQNRKQYHTWQGTTPHTGAHQAAPTPLTTTEHAEVTSALCHTASHKTFQRPPDARSRSFGGRLTCCSLVSLMTSTASLISAQYPCPLPVLTHRQIVCVCASAIYKTIIRTRCDCKSEVMSYWQLRSLQKGCNYSPWRPLVRIN